MALSQEAEPPAAQPQPAGPGFVPPSRPVCPPASTCPLTGTQTLAVQACPAVQPPQSSVFPHPSLSVPQDEPHTAGVQPQTFASGPPPQVSGAVHVPQLSVPPQLSDKEPQL